MRRVAYANRALGEAKSRAVTVPRDTHWNAPVPMDVILLESAAVPSAVQLKNAKAAISTSDAGRAIRNSWGQ
jgi:hypothetical protein